MRRKTYEKNRSYSSSVNFVQRRKIDMMQIKFDDDETVSLTKSGYIRVKDVKVGFNVTKFSVYKETKIIKTVMDVEWTYGELNKIKTSDITKAESRIKEMFNHL